MTPYKIAFIGFNATLTDKGLRDFARDNEEQLRSYSYNRREAVLEDGTIVKALGIDRSNLCGRVFDQIILCDDERWSILYKRAKDIELIKDLCMRRTIVPDEFQVL